MPSLASCYFCGEAVDASLDDYAVPPDAPADAQVTVTLCAGCKSKLDELLASIEPTAGPTSEDATPAEPVAGDPEPVFADEDAEAAPGDASDQAPEQAGDGGVTPADAPAETAFGDDEGPVEPEAASETPDPPDPGFEDGISFDEQPGAGGRDGGDGAAPDPSAPDGEALDDPDQEPDDLPGRGSEPPRTTDADPGSSDAAVPDRSEPVERSRSAGGADADGPLAGVSTRTYNRVVRLLQNREFPVDRAEFELLASNAYELDEGDVGAALDATIQKGLLDERDGMLRRPE